MKFAFKLGAGAFITAFAMLAFYLATPSAKAAEHISVVGDGVANYSSRCYDRNDSSYIENNEYSTDCDEATILANNGCGSCGSVSGCGCIVKEIRIPRLNVVRCAKVVNMPSVHIRKVFVPKTVCMPEIIFNHCSCGTIASDSCGCGRCR